jgi:hypothetical protein
MSESQLETIELSRDVSGGGGQLAQFDHKSAIYARKGKLYTCTCSKTAWKCEQVGPDTWCNQVCVMWNCKEIPAPGPSLGN